MKYTRKAIQTRYAGHLFRSRLEARWAAWFDLLNVIWTYEPFDAAGYIPDFLCRDAVSLPPFLVEVKGLPCDDPQMNEEATVSFDRVFRSSRNLTTVIVGCDPDFRTVKMLGDHCDIPFADGLVGSRVTELYPSQLAWLEEMKKAGNEHALAEAEYIFTGHPVSVGHVFRLIDIGKMESAWGHAHEVSRWMPVERT